MRESGLFGNLIFPEGPILLFQKRKEIIIMMKFCPYCGTELMSKEAVFCMGCGNKLPQGKSKQQERKDDDKRKMRRKPETDKNENPVHKERNQAKDNEKKRHKVKRINEQEQTEYKHETEDIMEMYADKPVAEVQYDEDNYQDFEEIRQYNPPVRKRRKPVDDYDDYDGYYDDVEPYDKGRIREDNILDMAKKVFIIIIAALLIVAVCVAMMYIL